MKCPIYYAALLLLSIFLTASSCDTTNMPDEDNNKDWNILEWTVDGEEYKAECEGDPLFGCDPVDCEYYTDVYGGTIHGSYYSESSVFMYIYKGFKLGAEYKLKKYDDVQVAVNQGGCNVYKLDSLQNYNIQLNYLDTNKKIMEGQFSFTGINDCQDTVKVSDGYFKLNYRP